MIVTASAQPASTEPPAASGRSPTPVQPQASRVTAPARAALVGVVVGLIGPSALLQIVFHPPWQAALGAETRPGALSSDDAAQPQSSPDPSSRYGGCCT